VRYWAFVNLATFVIAAFTHVIAALWLDRPKVEALALVPVFVMGIIDLIGLAQNRELIAEWLQKLLPTQRSRT
jgi:hypothetical protein